MKEKFKEYLPITEEQKNAIWEHAPIVFDTNILFNLYRYSASTRDDLLNVMEANADKLWMPYQVGFEYFNKREDIIDKMVKAHDALKDKVDSFKTTLTEFFNKDYSHHPLIKREDFFNAYDEAITCYKSRLDEWMNEMPSYNEDDTILTKLLELYEGKTGDDYPAAKLNEIYKEGATRYKDQIPPGYKDGKEKEHEGPRHMYGDLIIWHQVIDYAKDQDTDIIFVTEDLKEDWWCRRDGEIVSPRVELLREFHSETGKTLLMYSQEGFLSAAHADVKATTTEEVKVISDSDKKVYASVVVGESLQRLIDGSRAIPSYPVNAALFSSPMQGIIEDQKRLQSLTANPLTASVADMLAAQSKVTSLSDAIAKLALGKFDAGEWAKWYADHGFKKE